MELKIYICIIGVFFSACNEQKLPSAEKTKSKIASLTWSIGKVNHNIKTFNIKLFCKNDGDSKCKIIRSSLGLGMDLYSIKLISETGMEFNLTRKQYDLTGPSYRWRSVETGSIESLDFNLYDGTWNYPLYHGNEKFILLKVCYNGPIKINDKKKNISYSCSIPIDIAPEKLNFIPTIIVY